MSDARRLRTPESENAKLMRMLDKQMMDVATLKEMPGKTPKTRFEEECCVLGQEAEGLQSETRL